MNIALIYHKNPYTDNPRGGELSVKAIVEYLANKGHQIELSSAPSKEVIENADLVLAWGKVAHQTAVAAKKLNKPFVLMVRFWKNVSPLPVGNLMTRSIDKVFVSSRRLIFETAKAIITNTEYAKNVIERWQPVSKGRVHVSYVPITGRYEPQKKRGTKITVITPEIYGESWLIENLANQMPDKQFLVVNADAGRFNNLSRLSNVEVKGYMDKEDIWKQTKILLVPVYGNDICGTRRVTIEACRHGIPVIASDACGMSEKINLMLLVGRNAEIKHWRNSINRINENYAIYQDIVKQTWIKYDTPKQLQQFEEILLECVS